MNGGAWTIRRADADDLDAVVVLELEVFGSGAWSPRSVEEEFLGMTTDRSDRRDRSIWIAEETSADGVVKPVGHAIGRYVDGVADVQRIGVLRSRRGQRLGRELLFGLLEDARETGCRRAMLEVGADNERALALYAAAGFVEIDRRPRYYRGLTDAVVMQKLLTADEAGRVGEGFDG